jgi:hypothetical protein
MVLSKYRTELDLGSNVGHSRSPGPFVGRDDSGDEPAGNSDWICFGGRHRRHRDNCQIDRYAPTHEIFPLLPDLDTQRRKVRLTRRTPKPIFGEMAQGSPDRAPRIFAFFLPPGKTD